MRLRVAAANDDEVLVDDSGSGERDGLLFVVAAQLLAQIDAAVFSEARDGLTGFGVKAVEEIHDSGEDACGLTAAPVSDAARGLSCIDAGVELPLERARGGIECDDLLRERVGIEGAIDNERIDFKIALFAGIECPGDLELVNVDPVNLSERGIVVTVRASAVDGPVCGALSHGRRREQDGDERCEKKCARSHFRSEGYPMYLAA